MESKRQLDNSRNKVANKFLDKYLYTQEGFSNVKRIDDRDRQLKGVDIEFDYNGKHYVCDEKAATNYVNRWNRLDTFALELSSMQGRGTKVWRDGWFVNENLINDSYLFVWIDNAANYDISTISEDEITSAEICLVRKSAIREYLRDIGWSKKKLKFKDNEIRFGGDEDFGMICTNGCKFSFSKNLYEEPINVLLSRDTYRQISDFHVEITR